MMRLEPNAEPAAPPIRRTNINIRKNDRCTVNRDEISLHKVRLYLSTRTPTYDDIVVVVVERKVDKVDLAQPKD